jgi:hypothetical protein
LEQCFYEEQGECNWYVGGKMKLLWNGRSFPFYPEVLSHV